VAQFDWALLAGVLMIDEATAEAEVWSTVILMRQTLTIDLMTFT